MFALYGWLHVFTNHITDSLSYYLTSDRFNIVPWSLIHLEKTLFALQHITAMSISIIPHCDIIIKWFFKYASTMKTMKRATTTIMMMMKIVNNNKKNTSSNNNSKRVSRDDGRNESILNQSKLISGDKKRVNFINTTTEDTDDDNDDNDDHTVNRVDDNDDGDGKHGFVDNSYDSLIMNPDVLGMTFKECSKFAHDVGLVPFLYKEMQFYGYDDDDEHDDEHGDEHDDDDGGGGYYDDDDGYDDDIAYIDE
jgi:hypothetical protein